MKRNIVKFIRSVPKVTERKHYVEFITAALTIPVLLTVILVNLNNLNESKKSTSAPMQTPREIIIRNNPSEGSNTLQPTNNPVCKKIVGPISIAYPKEDETVSDNPVSFIIKYADDAYCSVVWSYRINVGTWSEYSSNSPSVYNLPNGNIKFELRVQSTVSGDQQQLERNFIYAGFSVSATPIPTLTPSPTVMP